MTSVQPKKPVQSKPPTKRPPASPVSRGQKNKAKAPSQNKSKRTPPPSKGNSNGNKTTTTQKSSPKVYNHQKPAIRSASAHKASMAANMPSTQARPSNTQNASTGAFGPFQAGSAGMTNAPNNAWPSFGPNQPTPVSGQWGGIPRQTNQQPNLSGFSGANGNNAERRQPNQAAEARPAQARLAPASPDAAAQKSSEAPVYPAAPEKLEASPMRTLAMSEQALGKLESNWKSLDPVLQKQAQEYAGLRSSKPADAEAYLAKLPAEQRVAVQGAGVAYSRMQSLQAGQKDLMSSVENAHPSIKQDVSTIADARQQLVDAKDFRDETNHKMSRVDIEMRKEQLKNLTAEERKERQRLDDLDLKRVQGGELSGDGLINPTLTPVQTDRLNEQAHRLIADRSHLPATERYDDGVVRVAGSAHGQLGGADSFAKSIFNTQGETNTLHDAIRQMQNQGVVHNDGGRQDVIASSNLERLKGTWDIRQNEQMGKDRGVLVAYHPDFNDATSHFIQNMQSGFGLNFGEGKTFEDVQKAMKEGKSGQFGNFTLVNPKNPEELKQAFEGMKGYKERLAYLGAHSAAGEYRPDMKAQEGLQGASEGFMRFGDEEKGFQDIQRRDFENMSRGFEGYMFFDACDGGSFVRNDRPNADASLYA